MCDWSFWLRKIDSKPCYCRFRPYHSGEVLVDGECITGPCPERGMVFQGYTLFPWKTVKENVMFGPQMRGASQMTAEAQAREWINIIGLENMKISIHTNFLEE